MSRSSGEQARCHRRTEARRGKDVVFLPLEPCRSCRGALGWRQPDAPGQDRPRRSGLAALARHSADAAASRRMLRAMTSLWIWFVPS